MPLKLEIDVDTYNLSPERAHSVILMGLDINKTGYTYQKVVNAITILGQLRACKTQKDKSVKQTNHAIEFHRNLALNSYNELTDNLALNAQNTVTMSSLIT